MAKVGDVMKIGFTVDTNMLEGKNARTTNLARNLELYLNYIEALTSKDRKNTLVFFLPQIVKDEVIKHETDKLNSEYTSLRDHFNELNYIFNGEFPSSNVEEAINNEIDFSSRLNILNTPISTRVFKKVIDGAINKKAPFIKKHGDAGFKDALIWESILASKEISNLDKFYYFTGDYDYTDYILVLEKEFNRYHKKTKLIIKHFDSSDDERRQNALSLIINENGLIKTNVIKLYDEKTILGYITKLGSEKVSIDFKEHETTILFENFTKKDFTIENVIEDNNKYIVFIKINTFCYENSAFTPLCADLKLFFEVKNKKLELTNKEISNVSFTLFVFLDYVDELQKLSKDISEIKELKAEFRSYEFLDMIKFLASESAKYKDPIKKITNAVKDKESNDKILDYYNEILEHKNNMDGVIKEVKKRVENAKENVEKEKVEN